MSFPLTDDLRQQYQDLFDNCTINPQRLSLVDNLAGKIINNRGRYESAGTPLSVPWYFIGVIHCMECSLNFNCHLHNGDPLTARTVHVPAGRPISGNPPFTWEESATDALVSHGLDHVSEWSLPGLLYQIERYNGFGYRTLNPPVPTPYLWSFSNNYTAGKFVADHVFDRNAVSQQCGAGVILRRMVDQGVVSLEQEDETAAAPATPTANIVQLASQVSFSKTQPSDAARALQTALNTVAGIALQVDGIPGPRTSDAVMKALGHFLQNDPRNQMRAAG
jgi:lysozyme family protein